MPLRSGLVILSVLPIMIAQDLRFQTATITKNQSGSSSGGSQILPHGKVIITNASIRDMLHIVYDVPDFAIIGAPEWLASEHFDIVAQAAENTSRDGLKQMMRKLLAEQFHLAARQETRSLPVFELRWSHTEGTLGPNIKPAKISCEVGSTAACPHEVTAGSFTATAMPAGRVVLTLAELAGRPVINKVNLSGLYDVNLTWTPGPSAFREAVRDQLGLELEPMNEPAQVLVIDRVEHLQTQ